MSFDMERRMADVLASLTPEDRVLETPPPSVWDAIAQQVATDSSGSRRADAPVVVRPDPAIADLGARRTRSALSRRARRATLGVVAAAAAVVMVVGTVVALSPSTSVVQEVALSSDLAGSDAGLTGRAELVETDAGLEIDVVLSEDVDAEGGYLELWLIDDSVEGMVSLGPLNETGRYPVPPGVDPDAFPIVDISVEPADGVPTHSGASVLRGRLAA